jgi:MFS family permease
MLAMAGDTIKFGYLPIYMADQLRISDAERGAVIAVQPLLEFLLLPVAARLADRFGSLRIMAVGAAMGAGANLVYGLSGSISGSVGRAGSDGRAVGLYGCAGRVHRTAALSARRRDSVRSVSELDPLERRLRWCDRVCGCGRDRSAARVLRAAVLTTLAAVALAVFAARWPVGGSAPRLVEASSGTTPLEVGAERS